MITEEIGQLILNDFPQFVCQCIKDPSTAFLKFDNIRIGIHLNDTEYEDGIHIDCANCRVNLRTPSNAYNTIYIANPNFKDIIEKFISDHNHEK